MDKDLGHLMSDEVEISEEDLNDQALLSELNGLSPAQNEAMLDNGEDNGDNVELTEEDMNDPSKVAFCSL